ncbi:MAG: response regulator [Ardenticatenaceae bacterium]|nr:response regulator [Ardenticatenaceae bacterium]MCB9443213.1 response regulator [Ardenticatenaceae bacterium]
MIQVPASPSVPATAVTHLLVVDDEPDIAESLADFLTKKENYQVSLASDGQEAVNFLKTALETGVEIDLVLLDMMMPGMTGQEVLDWIRHHPDLRYMRVVVLTAHSSSNEKVAALSAGADDYITKPYYPQELLARVKTILRTQQLEKQLQRQSEQLAALNQVGQRVAATLETQEVFATAVDGIIIVLNVTSAAILTVEGGLLRYQYVQGPNGKLPVQSFPRVAPDAGLIGKAFTNKSPIICNQPQGDGRFRPELDAPHQEETASLFVIPLVVRTRPVGVLVAYNKMDGPFSDIDLDLFASLASSVSEGLENAWLFQRNRLRQQELLEGRNTLQALIDGIPHPIYTINEEWQLISINKSKIDELQPIDDTLTGQTCYHIFFGRDFPCEHCQVGETLAHKQAQHWSVRWNGPDHLPREWDVDAFPIPGAKAAAKAVILWQDRTEERRLESSLLQAGKLAAIGQLAAGVAHEINNPLTAVNANAQLLKMVIPVEDENYESVDLIYRAGERAAKVVRGLLDFARQEQYDFKSTDINEAIAQALDLVQYQLQSANIDVFLDLAEDLPEVVASVEHLKSVWLNLLVNARDAVQSLPDNRFIEVTTRLNQEGDRVQVLVRDNGKGMSQAELGHIFEPFYTTKDPGKGTGLGLATCYRIVEQHNGEINVVSAVNEGTTFIVHLPVDR